MSNRVEFYPTGGGSKPLQPLAQGTAAPSRVDFREIVKGYYLTHARNANSSLAIQQALPCLAYPAFAQSLGLKGENVVTVLQEEQIRQLRSQGIGYRQIAKQLDLSRDDVRNYCKKYNLNGYKDAVAANMQMMQENGCMCRYCGSFLKQPKTGRKRHFCNDTCRRKWWNDNRDKIRQSAGSIYGFTCKRCGKQFTAYGNPHRQYCSHECYISDRFWGGEKPSKAIDIDMSKAPSVVLLNS